MKHRQESFTTSSQDSNEEEDEEESIEAIMAKAKAFADEDMDHK